LLNEISDTNSKDERIFLKSPPKKGIPWLNFFGESFSKKFLKNFKLEDYVKKNQ